MKTQMRYGTVPYVDLPVSRVVFGTTQPMVRGEDVCELLDTVYAAGINTFDSAASYGEAEASLGHWIRSRGNRKEIVLLTKGANPYPWRQRLTEYDILHDIENSFAKLGTDYIDVYILHRDDPDVPVGPIVELLNKLHQKGKIGAFGGSNWTLKRILEANQYAEEHHLIPFTVCSPSFSLAECIGDPWGGSVTISGEKNRDFRTWLKENEMPVFAYSSLARGFFSGRLKSSETERAKELLGPAAEEYGYPVNFERLRKAEQLAQEKRKTVSQIAFSWLMHQELNLFGITAPGSKEHILSTVEALFLPLSKEELDWLSGSPAGLSTS